MKNLVIGLLISAFFLTACGRTPPQTQPTPIFSIDNPTSTPSPFPTATRTLLPSATPTASITPLPTIPTFTPTFDVSTILTVTPAPKAECPKENPSLKPDTHVLFNQEGLFTLKDQALLDYLNNGGTPKAVINSFIQEFNWFQRDMGIQQDVTGDGIDEFILTDARVVFVFGCRDREYQTWLSDTDEPMWLQSISFNISFDMNMNGIPEIVTTEQGGHDYDYPTGRVSLFEWDGIEFTPLIQGKEYSDNQYFPFADTFFIANVSVYDTDGNGTLELVLESNSPSPLPSRYAHLTPWRNETHIYAWNGALFTLSQIEFTKPQYRYQALQDADQELLHGNYDNATTLYRELISNNDLKTWSILIAENEIAKAYAEDESRSTPTPVSPDTTEYPRLAAYAYYRIMLLHLVQGYESDAGTVYNTLQQKFGADPYARPYAEMASAFWEAYQSTKRMYDGCAAAIQYAVEHPEILIPLGSDYHGAQSHTYIPADVCPFR